MRKQLALAACVALMSPAVFAQTTVETERRVTTVQSGAGSVTTVEHRTVVRSYVTYLHEVYTAVGIPQAQIVQLIDLDIQILEARIRGDWDQVRVYIDRQVELVGPPVVQRIHTHVQSHPVPSSVPVYARPVWVDNVRVSGDDVNINIDANRTEIQRAVEQSNISVEQLNTDQIRQQVRSGDIEELKSETPASDNEARNNNIPGNAPENETPNEPRSTDDASASPDTAPPPQPGETPQTGVTPTPGETPRAGETPRTGATPRTGETPRAGETPRTNGTPRPGETPAPGETPRSTNTSSDATNNNAQPGQTPRTGSTPSTTGSTPTPATRSTDGSPSANQTPSSDPGPGNNTRSTTPGQNSSGQTNTPASNASNAGTGTGTNATPAPGVSSSNASSPGTSSGTSGSSAGTTND